MEDYKIVQFKPEYRDQVIKLIDQSLKWLKVIPESEEVIDDEDLFRIHEVYSGRGNFWVAVKNGEVVGTVGIRDMGGDQAKLNRMFVNSDFHGLGIGQKLIEVALDYAKAQEFKEVILNTHELMTRAHRFYEKNGFRQTGKEGDKFNYRLVL